MKKSAKREEITGLEAFKNFNSAMDALLKVPRNEIKARLDEEKR